MVSFIKNITLIFALLLPLDARSEWVPHGIEKNGNEIFYENKQIRRYGDIVYIWRREEYRERMGNGILGKQIYQQIDCEDYSYQNLDFYWYANNNWIKKFKTNDQGRENHIGLDSILESIANAVCQ